MKTICALFSTMFSATFLAAFLATLIVLFSNTVMAATSKPALDAANIDPKDMESLKRGAKYFADYCMGCHSASLMRYSRVGADLGIDEAELENMMIFTGAKVGDLMHVSVDAEDAKQWFGTKPPDLSVVARSRGVDWIYTFLRSFYQDPTRPWGVNNVVFKDVAMPHVLWELQGLQAAQYSNVVGDDGVTRQVITGFKVVETGDAAPAAYDVFVRDLVNFLHYMGEPAKSIRLQLGKWVILYLAIFFIVMYFLKKEYWKDVKKAH